MVGAIPEGKRAKLGGAGPAEVVVPDGESDDDMTGDSATILAAITG